MKTLCHTMICSKFVRRWTRESRSIAVLSTGLRGFAQEPS